MRFLMERLLGPEIARQIERIEEQYDHSSLSRIMRVQFRNGSSSPVLRIDDTYNLSVRDIDIYESAVRAWPGFGEWQACCFMVID